MATTATAAAILEDAFGILELISSLNRKPGTQAFGIEEEGEVLLLVEVVLKGMMLVEVDRVFGELLLWLGLLVLP